MELRTCTRTLLSGLAALVVLVVACAAESEPRFQYELTVEVGAEGASGAEGTATETFVSSELGLEYAIS